MNPGMARRPIPDEYDGQCLNIMRVCAKYCYPIGSAVYLGVFSWDSMFAASFEVRLETLWIRLWIAALAMVCWLLVPRARSLSVIVAGAAALYLLALLTLVGMLMLLPKGFILGVPGFLLVSGFCVIFCLRPIPAAISGLIGIFVLSAAFFFTGFPYQQVAGGILFFASGVLVSSAFMALLNHEFRKKRGLTACLETVGAHPVGAHPVGAHPVGAHPGPDQRLS